MKEMERKAVPTGAEFSSVCEGTSFDPCSKSSKLPSLGFESHLNWARSLSVPCVCAPASGWRVLGLLLACGRSPVSQPGSSSPGLTFCSDWPTPLLPTETPCLSATFRSPLANSWRCPKGIAIQAQRPTLPPYTELETALFRHGHFLVTRFHSSWAVLPLRLHNHSWLPPLRSSRAFAEDRQRTGISFCGGRSGRAP